MKTNYKNFSNEQDADNWINTHMNFFPQNNADNNNFRKALYAYTGNANAPINRTLRSDDVKNFSHELFKSIYNTLASSLPQYTIPDNIVVYRYISKTALKHMCQFQSPKRGMIMLDNGFMSTSLLYSSVRSLKRSHPDYEILLEIKVPIGTIGTYVGHINDLSEYEVLLGQNTKLRIDQKSIFNRYFQCTVVS